VKLGTVNPAGVATPWWQETSRGGKPSPATDEKMASMLAAEDVAAGTMALVDQAETCNIEMISLDTKDGP
jgi:NADP-dependent 3-hydroxy acid dehydrogenase YdfG